MSILLITPPLLQTNTPYPATPVLLKLLRQHGFQAEQCDLSIETVLRVFTPEMLQKITAAIQELQLDELPDDDPLWDFIGREEEYCRTITPVMDFLHGKRPELQWRIFQGYLPEGQYFRSDAGPYDDYSFDLFGVEGNYDRAKHFASLFLDDITAYIRETVDPGFGFGKYESHLAEALPTMDPLLERLNAPPTPIDDIIEELTLEKLKKHKPDFVGITIPFPGTLYGALKIAATIKKAAPDIKVIFGGGYVNSELRDLEDKRIFDYADYIAFDDGLPVLAEILNDNLPPACPAPPKESCKRRLLSRDGFVPIELKPQYKTPPMLVPDYDGLDLNMYFDVPEQPNRSLRLWSDGRWIKMQLANGCYWHKCAFCDLALDYIGRYEPADPIQIVDAMERLMEETGHCGFHFVDEAIPPALAAKISREIIKRGLHPVWWGNVRFDPAFTPEITQLMADAGCIAVTGGLECANDRLLKLMNKGITLKGAQKTMEAFQQASIMVHTYLMYAFPTETEEEVMGALNFVRKCFDKGLIHSAFWHRFALTVHSPIAAEPEKFGIKLKKQHKNTSPRFALNEIPYAEGKNAPDWDAIGQGLAWATYNYNMRLGLEEKVSYWFR